MRWRARAGLAIAILAILGVGFQPVSRWIVANTLSRFIAGQVRIEGDSHWDPWKLVWTCDQLSIELSQGERWKADRMAVRLNPEEFLRRNLVVDSAEIEGVRIGMHDPTELSSLDPTEPSPDTPAFSIEHWIDSVLAHHKSAILSASQSRDHRRRELQQQWNDLRERCQVRASMVDSHPYRSRQIDDQIRHETTKLSQALAEERIRIRELDWQWKQWSDQWRETWRDQLVDSISHSIPSKSASAHLFVKKSICEHWDAHQSLVSLASQATRPIREVSSNARGSDLALPGLPRNHTLIRTAHLSGSVEGNNGTSIRFRAHVEGLGDAASAIEPKSEWQFEPITEKAGRVIRVRVEHQNVAWCSDLESDSASRAAWVHTQGGNHLEVLFPIRVLASRPSSRTRESDVTVSDWQSCWDRAVQSHPGKQVAARCSLAVVTPEHIANPQRLREIELAPETATLVETIWDEAEDLYVDRLAQRAEPRISVVVAAIDTFLVHSWTNGMQEHLDVLADLEREVTSLKPHTFQRR